MKWFKSKKTKRLEWIERYLNKEQYKQVSFNETSYDDPYWNVDQQFNIHKLSIDRQYEEIGMILEHLGLEIKDVKATRKIVKKKND